ncbi:hypothetical protein HMPREF3221_00983 [Fusobacterium nucleatum]|uniref:Uncharacterized protein n=1 Tax=Fusobacterium nucleatum TaxID=851 RepID=A0A133P0P5_FUSNU|nr:hypothetical protein HMPREF3221_00983 [Fusobacterium nucleatum]
MAIKQLRYNFKNNEFFLFQEKLYFYINLIFHFLYFTIEILIFQFFLSL